MCPNSALRSSVGLNMLSVAGMTDRLRQCKPGRSFARSVAEGDAKQLSGFGERVPWSEAARLAAVQRLEARCSRVAFIVRAPRPAAEMPAYGVRVSPLVCDPFVLMH